MNFQLIALDSEHTHTLTVKSEEDRGKRWVIHIASKRVHYFLLFLRSLIHSLSSFSDTIKKTVKNRIEGELINNSTQKKCIQSSQAIRMSSMKKFTVQKYKLLLQSLIH